MTLTEPLFLLALALIPLGFLAARLAARRRARHAVRLTSTSTLAGLTVREPRWRRVLPATLLALATAALAVALARPHVTVQVAVERASVMLVTDASGSMRATDVDPSRLDAARNAVGAFLDEVPEEMRVGLLSYSEGVEAVQSPTTDRNLVREAAATIDAGGGTATGDALAAAIDRLRPESESADPAPSAILLLSDGMTSQGVDPVGIAERARDEGIPISTVALGTPEGTVTLAPGAAPRSVPPDPETLRRIAEISGGTAFTVDEAGELDQVYEQMGSELGTEPEEREASAGFVGLAALLLAGAVILGLRRGSRLT